MGVYIPNMEKPKSCKECLFEQAHYVNNYSRRSYCVLGAEQEHCPLIEIVTCGECNRSGTDVEHTFCMWLGALRKPTDFCSYGERRTDDNTD